MAPVDEDARVVGGDLGESPSGFGWRAVQVFVFPADPFDQVRVQLVGEEADQQGFVEVPIVVDPARHDAVDHRGDLTEGQVGTTAQPPPSNSASHVFLGGLADGGQKARLPPPIG